LTQSGHSVPDVAVLHNTACTLVVLLADYLLSLIVPEYWPPGHRWAVAGGGATGAVLQSLWIWLKSRRKPEGSN